MNEFKKYKDFDDNEIHYKIFKPNTSIPSIEFIMSYPNKDIWGDNQFESFDDGVTKYYKRININRDEWAKMNNYEDYADSENDFDQGVNEFNSDKNWQEYKTKINVHFLNTANEIMNKI